MSVPGNCKRGFKFDRDSDEYVCAERADPDDDTWEEYGGLVCMRIAGHAGEHIAAANLAAEADGVRSCCRVPVGHPHALRCVYPVG